MKGYMIEIETDLAREKRARKMYDKAMRPFMVWMFVAFGVGLLIAIGLRFQFGNSDLLNRTVSLTLLAICYLIFHSRAKAIVCRAGLPTQKRVEAEIVRRMGTEAITGWTDRRWLLNWAIWLFMIILGGALLSYCFDRSPSLYLSLYIICAFGYLVYFFNSKSSDVRVDERGFFGYAFHFWPRLVPWEQIEQIYIQRTYYPLTGKQSLRLILKDFNGKNLLVLGNSTFDYAPNKKATRIIAELKQGLTAATAPQGEQTREN